MVKGWIRVFLKRFGHEILGPPRAYAAQHTLAGLIRQEQINLVLDVGANTGQFVDELRAGGYAGRIVSFEPLATAHEELRARAAADPNWTVADRTAVGAAAGSVEIHVSGNSVSSSILEMLPSHSQAEPLSGYVGVERVPVNCLDGLCALAPEDRVLLKIDVQGYERPVLEGARNVLARARGIVCEMSLVPLYEGQGLAWEMWDLLAAEGFEAWSLEPGFRHPESGRMLQLDGVFVRRRQDSDGV